MRNLVMIVVFGFWLSSGSPARAQEFNLGIDFATVIPRGEFKQNIDNNGYGAGLQFTVGLGSGLFQLGVDFSHTTYGSETREVPLLPEIPEVTVDVRTSNNITMTHFLLRLQPLRGAFRPYVDGLIGFKYLATRTSVESDIDDLPLASETNFSDTAFSYGAGGGVQVRLARLGGRGELLLDGKLRYLRGSNARYLREGSIRRENGAVFFEVLSSRTDVLAAQFGVGFRF